MLLIFYKIKGNKKNYQPQRQGKAEQTDRG